MVQLTQEWDGLAYEQKIADEKERPLEHRLRLVQSVGAICKNATQLVRDFRPLIEVCREELSQPGRRVPVEGKPTWTKFISATFGFSPRRDHEPTGTVTRDELEYGRQDVRCTIDVLNALKREFDRHPVNKHRIELYPDKAVSPASVGKAYLRAMGITPPAQKFAVPDHIQGIASQAYFGGRAECRI